MEYKSRDWLDIADLKEGALGYGGMVIKSPKFQRVIKTISQLGPYKSTVLIQGESGTGKELAAHALHRSGKNPTGPFVIFNCSNLVDSLAESQLFGHVKGAFTDAREDTIGYFRAAEGGTLFLDEIGELPLSLQPKLLRAVETHEIQPIGSTRSHQVNLRLVAATNRNLREMVDEGTFRADLYYRLAATAIVIPPLRERREAIAALAAHFITMSADDCGKTIQSISREAIDKLVSYDWPGNLRELRHAMESAVMLAEGDRIDLDLLPPSILQPQFAPRSAESSPSETPWNNDSHNLPTENPGELTPRGFLLDDAIKVALLRALRQANGNCHIAAKLLGISRYTVYRMTARYGLGQVRNYRDDASDLTLRRHSA
jgi:two-component system response regulator AtoC